MTTPTLEAELTLTLTSTPTLNDLRHWWETRQADPDSAIAFTDAAPRNFAELLACIRSGEYLFYLVHHGDTVVGAMWLHDMVYDLAGNPRAGWLGVYVLPEHRGRHTAQTIWLLVHAALTGRGVRSLYIASHYANTRAHAVVERHHGFHRVGTYPAFARCQGIPTDFVIFSMRLEDMVEALRLARNRASMPRNSRIAAAPHVDDDRLDEVRADGKRLGRQTICA